MNSTDLDLALMCGGPLAVDGAKIYPFTVREIADMGYTNYVLHLSIATSSLEQFLKMIFATDDVSEIIQQVGDIKPIEFAFDSVIATGNTFVAETYLESFRVLLKDKNLQLNIDEKSFESRIPTSEDGSEYEVKYKITVDNIDIFVSLLKSINYIKSQNEADDMIPASKKAAELIAKLKKAKEKVAQAKAKQQQDQQDDISLADIVSAIVGRGNYTYEEVGKFTIYQLYHAFYRQSYIDQYDKGISAMFHGAKETPKPWYAKIKQ